MGRKIIDLESRRQQLWSEAPKPVQAPQPTRPLRIIHRDEPAPTIDENGVPGWAHDIPQNMGEPTCRKPDKCSGCGTPIWRWYQPDPSKSGEWRCCNCLIFLIKYDKECLLHLSLENCKASGVYQEDYLYYEDER